MANPQDAFPDNTPGRWYVDTQCIICGMCDDLAPEVFRPSPDYDHNLVHPQPVTPREIADAEDARERCPVEAIGHDRVPDQAAVGTHTSP